MPKPTAQYVNCLHCTRGPKGEKSCSSGLHVKSIQGGGCFLGGWLPGKEPATINGAKVERVEAPTYGAAWDLAGQRGYTQWIWVKDGAPQQSRADA